MNGKLIALLLIFLFSVFAFTTPADSAPEEQLTSPPPPTVPAEGKRLGLWMQWLSELQSVPVNEFVLTYFTSPPYFACLEIIYPVWHQTYNTFINWMDNLAETVDEHPVEIYVMLALDMGDQNHWNKLESALKLWQDNPSIYSVGVNCEHSKLHYPDNYNHQGFIRFQTLTYQYDKRFICYYFQNAPSPETESAFQWIAHVNWPNEGHRITLTTDWSPNTLQIGISAGLYDHNPDGYPDPDTPNAEDSFKEVSWVGHNRATITLLLESAFQYNHTERRCVLFSQMDLWDNTAFRGDVQELSEKYEIITTA